MEEPGSTPLAPRISAYLTEKFRRLVQSSAKHWTTKSNGGLPRFLTTCMQQYKVSGDYSRSSSSGQKAGSLIVEHCVRSGLMASFGSTEHCSSHVPTKSGILRKYFVQTEEDMALGASTYEPEVDSAESSGSSSCDAATIQENHAEIRTLYPDSEVESTVLSSPAIVESVYSDDTWRQQVEDTSDERIVFGNGCDLPAQDAYSFVGTESFDPKSAVGLDNEEVDALFEEPNPANFSLQGVKRKLDEPTKFLAQKRAKVLDVHYIDGSSRFSEQQMFNGHTREVRSTCAINSNGHVSRGLLEKPSRSEFVDVPNARQGHIGFKQTAADARAAYGEDEDLYFAEILLCANDALWHKMKVLQDLRAMNERLRKMMAFLEYQMDRPELEDGLWLEEILFQTRNAIWNSFEGVFESYLDREVFGRKLL